MAFKISTGIRRFTILALITTLLAISSGDRSTLAIAGPHMAADLGLSQIEMGWLFSAFAWAYVLAHVPAGWLVDRFGVKSTVLAGLLLWSVVTMFMASASWFAQPFMVLLLARLLLGAFESPVGPAASRIIAAWFPTAERGVAGSIFNCGQYIALVVFTPLMGLLDHLFGWEHIFAVMGVLGIAFAAIWLVFYEAPSKDRRLKGSELAHIRDGGGLADLGGNTGKEEAKPRLGDLAALFRSRMLVGIFITQYCIAAITWFFVTWFPSYLVKERGLSVFEASLMSSVPAIFGFLGGILAGFFSDFLLRRTGSLSIARKVPITIGLGMSALMIGCNYTDSTTLVIVLMSAAFFGKGFGSLGFTVIADTAPKKIIGLTGGVFNALGNTAGIVTPVVIGFILSATNSFAGALLYVGVHGLVAVFTYWVIVGPIRRLEIGGDDAGQAPFGAAPARQTKKPA